MDSLDCQPLYPGFTRMYLPIFLIHFRAATTLANLRADGPSSWQPFVKDRTRTYLTTSLANILPINRADITSPYAIKSNTQPQSSGGAMCGGVGGGAEGSDTEVPSLSRAFNVGGSPLPRIPPRTTTSLEERATRVVAVVFSLLLLLGVIVLI